VIWNERARPSALRAGIGSASVRSGDGVVGALAVVGVLAAAFVAWRRLAGGSDDDGWEPPPDEPPTPMPDPAPEAVAA